MVGPREHLVADRETDDAGPDADDGPGEVPSEHAWKTDRLESFVRPERSMMSIGLIAAAATLIRTFPLPTTGLGNSPYSNISGPP